MATNFPVRLPGPSDIGAPLRQECWHPRIGQPPFALIVENVLIIAAAHNGTNLFTS